MRLFRIFHIGSKQILTKGHSTAGIVTEVQRSALHTIKKPVRLYLNESNTVFSHFIKFLHRLQEKLSSPAVKIAVSAEANTAILYVSWNICSEQYLMIALRVTMPIKASLSSTTGTKF